MSEFSETLKEDIHKIAVGAWTVTQGRVVPAEDSIGLMNVGVELEATMLYADLADSTSLAMNNTQIAAEVYKAFLLCCSRIINRMGGEIRAFDGDRVMAVFIGDMKNTRAAKTALQINWGFKKIIVPSFAFYEDFKTGKSVLRHAVGVDTSEVLVARGGMRDHNDLIWIGRAPNIAAKLSGLREAGYASYITADVFSSMAKEAKTASDGREMWEGRTWTALPESCRSIYRSSWTWSL